MHILSINFISFTAQMYNALHMQSKKGDFGILGGMAPLVPLPKSAYDCM